MSCLRYQFITTTELAIKYLHKSKRSLKCLGKYNEHLAVLVKPREKNKHGLDKAWHWVIWADKADGMFWEHSRELFTNEFSCQVDRFNKAKEQI